MLKLKETVRELRGRMQLYFSAFRNADFEPYIKELEVDGIRGNFFFATPQAKEWYDPLKPYARLEYEWVIQNVPLKNANIIDGGAHHGQYSVFFALAAEKSSKLVSVDPYPMNCSITQVNLSLNGCESEIQQCAISDMRGKVHFTRQSNGRILDKGGIVVEARPLEDILPDANVIKLDVEGAEYNIVPASIDKMSSVHTWIIEVHPIGNPHPDQLITCFLERGFNVFYLNREKNRIEAYRLKSEWPTHSTIFAVRH